MLDWKEIIGIKNGINYIGLKEQGIDLPELNEEVLICSPNYRDKTKDIFFLDIFMRVIIICSWLIQLLVE